jgi:uncharacterized membrane protein
MNLNVITTADAVRTLSAVRRDDALPAQVANEGVRTQSGKAPQITADDLYSRLLKYIPAPLIGTYLFLVDAVHGGTGGTQEPAAALLWSLLVVFLAVTAAWLVQRGVKRPLQIGASILAFAAFATASQGPFQTIPGWQPYYSTLAIGIVAALLLAFRPGPLPEDAST